LTIPSSQRSSRDALSLSCQNHKSCRFKVEISADLPTNSAEEPK